MRFGSVGAVIAAASKKDAVPLLKVGSIPIVRRIVLTLQQAGVFPIVVVTGTEELEVIRQVAPLGVVFIKNKECEKPELFSSVKLGLSYLQGKRWHFQGERPLPIWKDRSSSANTLRKQTRWAPSKRTPSAMFPIPTAHRSLF